MFDEGIDIDEWHKEVKVTWIVGPSGVGKSLLAQKMLKEEGYKKMHIVKHDENGFWDKRGVGTGYGAALYDEFRDSDMKTKEFINFIDYNRHYMNVKGGSVLNNFERIIITSVQRPEQIYSKIKDDEPRKQWLRRMNIIDLNPKDDDESFVWEHYDD
jgi:guanylate kinase